MLKFKVMKSLAGRPYIKFFATIRILFMALTLLFSLSACLNEGSGSEDSTQVVADPEQVVTPPLTTPERTVCDPFDVGSSAQDRGLIGNLLYLTDDQPRYSSVQDYIDYGHPIESTLYFDRLFVPTRGFDLGFYTQEGTLILNQNDEPIYEYFALRLESQLTLSESEPEGWYQMALLSDDGSMLYKKESNGSLTPIVSNDGNHSTQMGCGSAIYLDHNSKIPVVLYYHQGPRFHIALSVLWRHLDESEDPNSPIRDSECGRSGNSRYFDSTVVPSKATSTFYDMLSRDWKVLNNENYYFPVQANNPCAIEDPLLITNFNINSSTRTSVSVSWSTSLLSSSQIEVKNITTGVVTTSPLDNNLVLSHSLTLSGLTANTLYSVRAISQSSSGQTVFSSESAFRTPR
jgi:hypothetical protein